MNETLWLLAFLVVFNAVLLWRSFVHQRRAWQHLANAEAYNREATRILTEATKILDATDGST